MQSNPLPNPTPLTDGDTTTKIKFDTVTEYKIGKTTYRVTAHYTDNGEQFREKIAWLLKQNLDF